MKVDLKDEMDDAFAVVAMDKSEAWEMLKIIAQQLEADNVEITIAIFDDGAIGGKIESDVLGER